jgi:hypothetical protein
MAQALNEGCHTSEAVVIASASVAIQVLHIYSGQHTHSAGFSLAKAKT